MAINWAALGDIGKNFVDAYDSGRKEKLENEGRLATLGMARELAAMYGGDGGAMTLASLGTGGAQDAGGTSARSLPSFANTGGGAGDYLSTLIGKESGNDPNARNPMSSAAGLGQFTSGTWAALGRSRPDLGLTPDGRTDEAQSKRAIVALADENAKVLSSQGGHDPSPGNLYLAHFLGGAGAAKFLTGLNQNPNAPATSYVGRDQVAANRSLFYRRDGTPKSAAEFYAERTSRFGGGDRRADLPMANGAEMGFMPGEQPSPGFFLPPGGSAQDQPAPVQPQASRQPATLAELGQITGGGYGVRPVSPPAAPATSAPSAPSPDVPFWRQLQGLGDPAGNDPSYSPGAGGIRMTDARRDPNPIRYPMGTGDFGDEGARLFSPESLGPAQFEPSGRSGAAPPLPPRRPASIDASADPGQTLPEVVVPPSPTGGAPARSIRVNPTSRRSGPVQEPSIPAQSGGAVPGYGNNDRDGGALAFALDPSAAGAAMPSSPSPQGRARQALAASQMPPASVEAPVSRPAMGYGAPAPAAPVPAAASAAAASGADPEVAVTNYPGTWTRSSAPGDGQTGPTQAEVAAAQRATATRSAAPQAPVAEPETATAPARMPNGMPNWQSPQDVPAPIQGSIGKANLPKLIMMTANPNLPAGMREVAKMFLTRALDEAKIPDGAKEFLWARANGMTTASSPAAYAAEKKSAERADSGDKVREEIKARQEDAETRGQDTNDPAVRGWIQTGRLPDQAKAAEMKATEQKMYLQNVEKQNILSSQIKDLTRALEINPQVYSGNFQPGAAAAIARNSPGWLAGSIVDPKRVTATTEYNNLVGTATLSQGKELFGARVTNYDEKLLQDLKANPNMTPAERETILRQMIAHRRQLLSETQDTGQGMKSGTFFRRGAAGEASAGRPRSEVQGGGNYPDPGGGQAPGRAPAPQADASEPSSASPQPRQAPRDNPAGRFSELVGRGMTKQQAYARLAEEGY